MFHELQQGARLTTKFHKELVVVDRLGDGGQGVVYKVLYDGQPKALKWYRPDLFDNLEDRDKFIQNLSRNIRAGRPTPEFLWPIDMTALVEGSFGYVMDLRPPEYVEASDLFLDPGLFPTFRRAIDTCLHIVSAFRVLHDKGYCYQDVNGGNFFVNPQTGAVLICDNDNVAPAGTDTGIRGTPRFMAPEIVCENKVPSTQSDLHSMAVLIFFLLMAQHPLEGRRMSQSVALDSDVQRRLYGTDPLFVMDPNDRSNRPDGVHVNVLKVWPTLPKHMQEFFMRAFSQDALHQRTRRISEYRWTLELARLRSEVVVCSCGNEVFLQDARPVVCDNVACGREVRTNLRAELEQYYLPVSNDMRIYRCQTCICNADEALDPMAWFLMARGDAGVLGVRNMSYAPWQTIVGDTVRQVPPRAALPVSAGMTLCINGSNIRITENVHEASASESEE